MRAGPWAGGRSGAAADPCVHLRRRNARGPLSRPEAVSGSAARQTSRGGGEEAAGRRGAASGSAVRGNRGRGAVPADPWWPGPPAGSCAERVCGRQPFGKAAGLRAPSCSPPVTPPRRGRGCLPPGFVCPWNQCFFSLCALPLAASDCRSAIEFYVYI